MIVFEKWALTKNLTEKLTDPDADAGVTTIARPSIDASYQVSDHLAMWFQRRRFLEIDQSETKIACGGHVC